MILDTIGNAAMYRSLGPRFAMAMDYLAKTDLSVLSEGKHEIDGDRVFATVSRYKPKALANAKWEAHRRYVDVQYILAGAERMGYTPLHDGLMVTKEYNPEKDVVFYAAGGDLFVVPAGTFAIFTPYDIHAPSLSTETGQSPCEVRKVLVKLLA